MYNEPLNTCRRCDEVITVLKDDIGQAFRCQCGVFEATCDNCGSPYDGEDGSCSDCYADACDKDD